MNRTLKSVLLLLLTAAFITLDTTRERLNEYWGVSEAIGPFFALLAASVVLFLVLYFLSKSQEKAIALTMVLVLPLFWYGDIVTYMSAGQGLLVLLAGMTVASFLVWRYNAFRQLFLPTVIVTIGIYACFRALDVYALYAQGMYDMADIPPRKDLPEMATARKEATPDSPDIYFIMLDAYAANPTLKRLFGFDNSAFLDALRARGFYVAPDSRSSYMQTMLSVSSTLNFNYFHDDVILPNVELKDRRPAVDYYLRPRLTKYLQDIGYDLHQASNAYAIDPSFDKDNMDIRAPHCEVNVRETMLAKTPIHQTLTYLLGQDRDFLNPYKDHYYETKRILESVPGEADEAGAGEAPDFVYAHLLMPHPPFVFTPEGEFAPYANMAPFSYADGGYTIYGDLYEGGWLNFYRRGYIDSLQYVNKAILQAIDEIQSRESERPTVIILTSDHGSRTRMNFASPEGTDVQEAFHVLAAVYYSDGDYTGFTPDISPLNIMRLTMNKYFGTSFSKLENRSWYSSWHTPYDFVEVTEQLDAEKMP